MSRAQDVRHHRLMQREIAKQHISLYKNGFSSDLNASILFNWVLDLFESPQRYNTFDVVDLSQRNDKIVIGNKFETDYDWDSKALLLVASMFENEPGYLVQKFDGKVGICHVIIEIK